MVGGTADSVLDTGEAVTFRFSSPATLVSFFVQLASNGDGDSLLGEAWVEGYEADGSLLGVHIVSGTGTKNVSALFGVPLSAFRVLPKDGDSLRVGSLNFNLGSGLQTIDFGNIGTYRDTRFIQSGLTLTAEANLPLLNFLNFNGLGVVGGTADSVLDTGEAVTFRFSSPATLVSFFVQLASNGDGDSLLGEAWVEGYGADGSLLGVHIVSGTGTKNVSALFGVPLSAFRVLPKDGDSLRIGSISFNLGRIGQTIDFQNIGTYKDTLFEQSGLMLTAEANLPLLNFLNFNGLGVVGGTADSVLDTGEAVTFRFSSPATLVSFFVQLANNGDGDSLLGEAWVEGYGADGSLLGVHTVSGTGTKNISALFGVPLSALRVLPKDGDSLRIGSVSFRQFCPSDFDGDEKTDIAVYRTTTGAWYIIPSGGASPYGVGWGGNSDDKPVPGDYDGDLKTDLAVYRSTTGTWFIYPSGGGSPYSVGWGGDSSDKPVPGDYDGDLKTDLAVYRSTTGTWFIYPSGSGSPYSVGWGGNSDDKPVPGDYDGDGKTDIAIYRKSTGAWYIYPSGGGAPYGVGWGGNESDKPVPGDYDGDGKTDIAVYRNTIGEWYIKPSSGTSPYGIGWGGDPSDKPVIGDYDGDLKIDIAVYRTTTGAWYIIPSGGASPYGVGWGGDSSDIPVTMNLSAVE